MGRKVASAPSVVTSIRSRGTWSIPAMSRAEASETVRMRRACIRASRLLTCQRRKLRRVGKIRSGKRSGIVSWMQTSFGTRESTG